MVRVTTLTIVNVTGSELLSNFQIGDPSTVGSLQDIAAAKLGLSPGYECALSLDDRVLSHTKTIHDAGISDGAVIVAVVQTLPLVSLFLTEMQSLCQFLRDWGPNFERDSSSWNDKDKKKLFKPLDILRRLGPKATPATSDLVDLLRDECDAVREVSAWCFGMVGASAIPYLNQLAAATWDSNPCVCESAASSLAFLAKAQDLTHNDHTYLLDTLKNELVMASDDDYLRPDAVIEAFVRAILGLLEILGTADRREWEWLIGYVLISPNRRVRPELTRVVASKDRAVFRRVAFPDLYHEDTWREAARTLDQRLHDAYVLRRTKRQAASEKLLDLEQRLTDVRNHAATLCEDNLTTVETLEEKVRALKQELEEGEDRDVQVIRNSNDLPFQGGVACSHPLSLRASMHGDPMTFDFFIRSEAGWRCFEPCVVALDKLAASQDALHARRLPSEKAVRWRRASLRAHFMRSKQGASFFKMLDGIDGADPFHGWIFPDRSRPPLEDFEPRKSDCNESLSWMWCFADDNTWRPWELEADSDVQWTDDEATQDAQVNECERSTFRAGTGVKRPKLTDCHRMLMIRDYSPTLTILHNGITLGMWR